MIRKSGYRSFRKEHAQTKRSSGMTIRRKVIALCRFRFEIPVANSRHPVQELQIGGTRWIVIGRCTLIKPTSSGFSAPSQLPWQDSQMTSAKYDVLGIGNAIFDILVQTDESFLSGHGMIKGGMSLID